MDLLKRCFVCSAELPHTLSASLAGKFAVDPARGRLWLICDSCGMWNLVPIEVRWETIETLERLARDQGRVLAKTANVALVEVRGVTIVRVGRTERREEAWWRYKREAEERIRRARHIIRRGKWKDAFWTLMLFGIPLPGLTDAETWLARARTKRFPPTLWSGRAPCKACGWVEQELEHDEPLVLLAADSGMTIRGLCSRCGTDRNGVYEISGIGAERIAQRALAYRNFAGPSWWDMNEAVHDLDSSPSANTYLLGALTSPVDLTRLPKARLVGLEMAINESREAELLTLELRALEERWKTEEELAFIVDRELTPPRSDAF